MSKVSEKQFEILEFVFRTTSEGKDAYVSGFHKASRAALEKQGFLHVTYTGAATLTHTGKTAYLDFMAA